MWLSTSQKNDMNIEPVGGLIIIEHIYQIRIVSFAKDAAMSITWNNNLCRSQLFEEDKTHEDPMCPLCKLIGTLVEAKNCQTAMYIQPLVYLKNLTIMEVSHTTFG